MNKRILIVDDDEYVLFILQRALSKLGSEIEIAKSGQEALAKAEATPFDLIFTDIGMPDGNGVELTQAINQSSPSTVVVWVTAYDCRTVAKEASQLNVRCCLDKPLEIDEIRQVAREALGNGVQ